jgi:type III pantothenate kinase
MLLAVDIGNTQTVLGVFDGDELRHDWRMRTTTYASSDEIAGGIAQLLSLRGLQLDAIDRVVVSSVVPVLTGRYQSFVESYLGSEVLLVGPGTKTGLRIAIDNPHEAGADRIVNAVAARERFGERACIVVDLGTATTFDAVSAEGAYLGGAIAPGLGVSVGALVDRAAQLASVELVVPDHAIGTSTVTSMQSGALIGTICQVEGMLERFRAELGDPEAPAVATGGLATLIAPHVSRLEHEPRLTLTGLRIVAQRND